MSDNSDKKTVFIVAGEPSGDLLASRLMRALKRTAGDKIAFAGVGGETMAKEGLKSLFDITDLAVMGLAEVIPSIPLVLKRIKQTVDEINRIKPDVVITVDSWGFTGRVNEKLYKQGSKIPRVHYVAPQVWAWREHRAKKMTGVVNHLLALLPNEPEYFTPYGLETTHVGHPVIESSAALGDGVAFRERSGIDKDIPLLCVLPGSRHNETGRLLPVFEKAVNIIAETKPDVHVVMPTVPTVSDEVIKHTSKWKVPVTVVRGEKERYDAFSACDAAIAASGTVALELAIAGVPHIIAYKLSFLTAFLARRLIKIKYANLLNMFADKEIVPELLLEKCKPELISEQIIKLLDDETLREEQKKEATKAMSLLGNEKELPSDKAAAVILDIIGLQK